MLHTKSAKKNKIREILVPIDFSEASSNAFTYALHITEMLDAKLILLHVYQDVPVNLSYIPADFVEALKGEKREEAQELLQNYLAEAQLKVKKNVKASSFLRSGHAASEIVEAALELKADLIIMGTQGGDSPSELILGSVTAEVIRRATCPVLAIPALANFKPIQKIMYALGMEANDPIIIEELATLSEALGANLICANIQSEEASWQGIELSYVKKLEKLEKDGRLTLDIYHKEDIIKGLRDFIEAKGIDLIAMKTHESPVSSSKGTTSLTRKMVMESRIPVLALQDN